VTAMKKNIYIMNGRRLMMMQMMMIIIITMRTMVDTVVDLV
jgi:hypothetical protein